MEPLRFDGGHAEVPTALAWESRSTRAGCGAASKNSKKLREPPETSKRTVMNDTGWPDGGSRFIGKPLSCKEDARLTTGKGRFTDDFSLDGQAYAVMVRSPYPHARIVSIDACGGEGDARRAWRCSPERTAKPTR